MKPQHRTLTLTLAAVGATGLSVFAVAQGLPKLAQKPTYKVGFAQTESNNPWRIAQTKSMQDEAKKLGYQLVYTDAAGSAAKQVADSNWSRFPVSGRDQDDVVGFVHVRDLFLPNHPAGRAATVGDLAREVKRLPGTAGVLTARRRRWYRQVRRRRNRLVIRFDGRGGPRRIRLRQRDPRLHRQQ